MASMDDRKPEPLALGVDQLDPEVHMANYVRVDQRRAIWGERRISDIELILVLEGRFEYVDEAGQVAPQLPGQVLVILPGEPHVYRRAPGCSSGQFSCIHCELLRGASWERGDYLSVPRPQRITEVEDLPLMTERFHATARCWSARTPCREALLANRVREIWQLLSERWLAPQRQVCSERTQRMLGYLREHAEHHPGRSQLARRFGLSPQHVNHLFKSELGMSPIEVVHRECCHRAYRLLREEALSVREAAERVGFADPFYFSRVFTRIIGFPPSRV